MCCGSKSAQQQIDVLWPLAWKNKNKTTAWFSGGNGAAEFQWEFADHFAMSWTWSREHIKTPRFQYLAASFSTELAHRVFETRNGGWDVVRLLHPKLYAHLT
tara:strand:+ start:339 stop:644 length:306 start_codon:yes stop_codon:yes gene_type:complete